MKKTSRQVAHLVSMILLVGSAGGAHGQTGSASAPVQTGSASAPVQVGSASAAPEAKERSLKEIFESWFPGSGEETVEEAGGMPAALEDSATPIVATEEILSLKDLRGSQAWQAPSYSSQNGKLGWTSDAFAVPDGLRGRVNFWRDIYARYSTNQGLMHDSVNVELVYAPVDFNAIMQDPSLNPYQKARAREKLVNDKRNEINQRLRSLHGRENADGLSGEDLRIFKMFEIIKDPNKFLIASEKGRVRFQLGQRDKFIRGIFYSGRYLKEMEKIFRDEGLPIELTRLPFVESSFDINARSKVRASGVWQFMRRTARPFMKVNKEIDERNDPIKATWASAKLLRQNYQMLQSWPLAVTGYNHGPYGVQKIVNKLGTRDLTQIVRTYSSRTFGFASENFYACFLAAVEVERDARKYFGDVKWSRVDAWSDLKVVRNTSWGDLLEFFDQDERSAMLANPHFTQKARRSRGSLPMGAFFRVPSERVEVANRFNRGLLSGPKLVAAIREIPLVVPGAAPVTTPVVSAQQNLPAAQVSEPKLQEASATGSAAASAASPGAAPTLPPGPIVSIEEIAAADLGEDSDSNDGSGASAGVVTASAVDGDAKAKAKTHKVKRGDNLTTIARRYRVEVSVLMRLNSIEDKGRRRAKIKVGDVLKIPQAGDVDSRNPQSD